MEEKAVYFNPIKSKRTFDEIAIEIKKMIVGGVLRPGDRLPSEAEIAKQFNVGRQTVREALRLLELSGFVMVHKGGGGGAIITNTIIDTIRKSFMDAAQMRDISVAELTYARAEIEKLVICRAVENSTDEDIAVLNENITQGRKAIASGVQAFEENMDFHVLLAKASKNAIFAIIVESLMAIVSDLLSRIPQSLEISKKILEEHKQMVDAIAGRDKDRAIDLLDKHLDFVGKRFNSSFEELAKQNRVGTTGERATQR
ncbi:MAG: FCD domain-containing protein [Syntrophobacterales bacterium]|jgi:DNA-binding FadR family transcriptional regulator|nr:FCD domain-containing protein [Syntrophobacterales bacterium]